MKYHYTSHTTKESALALFDSIEPRLISGDNVLLLLSGGSGIDVALQLSTLLKDIETSTLTVSLTDERYGKIGHANENWQQLLDKGFLLPQAKLRRVLQNVDALETTILFNIWLEEQLSVADYTVGLFGIGADGHTAGIKPHSLAVDSEDLVAFFIGDDFERITITPRAIQFLDEAIIQVSGKNKIPTITTLLRDNKPVATQPAQILKKIPICTLVTDIKEK